MFNLRMFHEIGRQNFRGSLVSPIEMQNFLVIDQSNTYYLHALKKFSSSNLQFSFQKMKRAYISKWGYVIKGFKLFLGQSWLLIPLKINQNCHYRAWADMLLEEWYSIKSLRRYHRGIQSMTSVDHNSSYFYFKHNLKK